MPRLLGLIDTDQHIIADYVSDTEVRPRGVRTREVDVGLQEWGRRSHVQEAGCTSLNTQHQPPWWKCLTIGLTLVRRRLLWLRRPPHRSSPAPPPPPAPLQVHAIGLRIIHSSTSQPVHLPSPSPSFIYSRLSACVLSGPPPSRSGSAAACLQCRPSARPAALPPTPRYLPTSTLTHADHGHAVYTRLPPLPCAHISSS